MHYPLLFLAAGLIAGNIISMPVALGARVTLLDVSVVVLVLYGALRSGKKRIIPHLWAPIIAFTGICLISLAQTVTNVPLYVVGGGLLYVLRFLLYAALYWTAVGKLFSPAVWRRTLTLSGVCMAGVGLLQYFWYPDLRNLAYLGWDPHYQRLFGTLLDPNFMGIILTLTLLSLLGTQHKGMQPFMRYGLTGLVLLAFVLTYSRSAIVALVGGLIVWAVLSGYKKLAGIVIAAVLVGFLLLPNSGEGRNLFRSVSSYARVGNAQRAITLIKEKPLFGHGFNLLRFVARERSWLDESTVPSRAGAGLDTSLLFVGATTGLVGFGVYVWLLVSLYGSGIRLYRAGEKHRMSAATYLGVLTALLLHSLFVNSLFYPWVLVWLWILTGTVEQEITAYK